MSKQTADATRRERRGFLKGSALFAAAFALSAVTPAAAQAPQDPQAPPEDRKEEPARKDETEKKPKPLIDKDGREYRVCDMCGANMYKDGKTWTCEQCGYSYDE